VLDGGSNPPCEGAIVQGKGMPGHAGTGHAGRHYAVSYAKMPEPIEMSFQLWTQVG